MADPLLAEVPFLIVDCQTTGSSPGKGHLLEVAWTILRSGAEADDFEEPDVHSFLTALPEGVEIPRRISRITGITVDDMKAALPPGEVAHLLGSWVSGSVPVAHFGVFEQRWFDDLLRSLPESGGGFPGIICTRELARRLYPGLPRKGLRAVAGYLGYTVGEHRRAPDHVRATVAIWRSMQTDLDRAGVRTLGQLRELLALPAPTHDGSYDYLLPKEVRLGLPDSPGVYRLLSVEGSILYVGKASSLRKRVNSYFTKRKAHGRTLELVSQVADVDVSLCETPLESALEEFLCIREHAPQYNQALRERGLELVHLDPSLDSVSGLPDREHRLGPVPSHSPALMISDLVRTIAGGTLPDPSVLGMDYLPLADGALEEGVGLFRERHCPSGATIDHLLREGLKIWRLHMAADQGEDETSDPGIVDVETAAETEEELREPPKEIDMEGVLRNLEWILVSAARDLRRAAWYRLLGWSRLQWRPPAGDRWRSLNVHGGMLTRREWLSGLDEVTECAGHPSRSERQAMITPKLYCLLGVLQSEIRRVLHSGAPARLLLPTGRTLEAEVTGRVLALV